MGINEKPGLLAVLFGGVVASLFAGCHEPNEVLQEGSSADATRSPTVVLEKTELNGLVRTPMERQTMKAIASNGALSVAPEESGEFLPPIGDGHESPIMGGTNVVELDDWYSFENVVRNRAVASLDDGHCTGVLVSPYHILTAAHCIDPEEEGYPEIVDTITHGIDNNDSDISCAFLEEDDYSTMVYNSHVGEGCENSVYPSMEIDGVSEGEDGIYYYPAWESGREIENDIALVRLRYGVKDFNHRLGYLNIFDLSDSSPSSPDVIGEIAPPFEDDVATILGYGTTCAQDEQGDSGNGPLRFGWGFRVESTGSLFRIDGNNSYGDAWGCGGDSGAPVFDSAHRLIGIKQGRGNDDGDRYDRAVKVHGKALWVQQMIIADNLLYDGDGDGFYDYDDACPGIDNYWNTDLDNDGVPDACDPCSPGYYNGSEDYFSPVCTETPGHFNCLHGNMDPFAFSSISSSPGWWYEDEDGDRVPNACDNCWNVANPDQADTNENGATTTGAAFLNTGDACDPVPSLALSGNGVVTSIRWGDMSKFGCSKPAPLVRVDFATVGKSTDATTQNPHVMMAWCDCDGNTTSDQCQIEGCPSGQTTLQKNRRGYYPMTHEPDGYYSSSETFDETSVNLSTNRFENMSTSCGTPGDPNDSNCPWPDTWPDENDWGLGWTGLDAELCSRQTHPFAPALRNEAGMSWRWQQELWWKKRATITDAQTPLSEIEHPSHPGDPTTWWGRLWFQAAQYDPSLAFDVPFSIEPMNCWFNWVAKPIFSTYDYIPNFEDPCQGCPEVVDNSLWDIYSHFIVSGRSEAEGQYGKFSFPGETIPADSAISSLRVAMFDRQTGVEKGEAYSVFPDGVAIGESSFAAVRFGWSESGFEQLLQQTLASQVAEPQSTAFALFGGEDEAGALSDRLWLGLAYGGDEDLIPYVSWRQSPSTDIAPEARKDAALVFDNAGQRLLLFGGEGETGLLVDLWAYDLGSGSWSELEAVGDVPAGLAGATVVPWHDRALLVGGTTRTGPSDAVFSIDRETGEFARLIELSDGPGSRTQVAAAVHRKDRALYFFGGELDGEAQNDLWRFDLARWMWEQLAPSNSTGEVPETSTSNLLLTGRLQGGGVFVYTGADLNDGMPYWRWSGDHWISDFENEPWSDFDADGIPNSHDDKSALLVADGYYVQEQQIEEHLESVNGYDVEVKNAGQITGTTPLDDYDLIVISEFAPGISTAGRQNIAASGVPLLIVEYWDFWYSYKFGLTTTSSCGYYGKTTVRTVTQAHPITTGLGDLITVYSPSYTVYGINKNNVKPGVTKLVYNSNSTTANEVAVMADDTRGIVATGIYDTRKYTADGWNLFDRCVAHLETYND